MRVALSVLARFCQGVFCCQVCFAVRCVVLAQATWTYNRVKKNQLDAQLILSIFQPLHVSGVSRPIIRRYNHMYTTIGTYYSFWMTVCCSGWIGIDSNPTWKIRFGRIQAHHQEVQPYVYNNWYLLFFLDDCLLSWTDCSIKMVFIYTS